jgi:hypothetical protein
MTGIAQIVLALNMPSSPTRSCETYIFEATLDLATKNLNRNCLRYGCSPVLRNYSLLRGGERKFPLLTGAVRRGTSRVAERDTQDDFVDDR